MLGETKARFPEPRMPVASHMIDTTDGACPAYLHTPDEQGYWPGVIVYMDGPGIRPAIHDVAARIASHGYAVLLPDLFYRAGPYEPVDPKVVFSDETLKKAHRDKYMSTANGTNAMADTKAFLQFMDTSDMVADGPYGTVGYCMGGKLALLAAGTFPGKFAAAASYHGGGLANDAPDSPHRLAKAIKARVYVAGAIEDSTFPDEMKRELIAAFTEARLDFAVETYPAKHGWVLADHPAHDTDEAEHHWRTLLELFDATLND